MQGDLSHVYNVAHSVHIVATLLSIQISHNNTGNTTSMSTDVLVVYLD
jgi:hypothetical protein